MLADELRQMAEYLDTVSYLGVATNLKGTTDRMREIADELAEKLVGDA